MNNQLAPVRKLRRFLVPLMLVAAMAVIRAVFLSQLGTRAPFVVFYPVVIIAALYGGFTAGLLATALSACAATYFLEPFGVPFRVMHPSDQFSIVVFLVGSVMMCAVVDAMHRAHDRAEKAEREAESAEERAYTSELLREREGLLATTLHSIGDAVLATDTDGRISMMNGVAEQLTGWKAAEARGKEVRQVFNIVDEFTREPVESPVVRCLRDDVIVGLANHTILIGRDGRETPIDDSGAPIRDSDGNGLGAVLVFRDITGRKRAEDELRRADKSKDEFLAMLAHELRNPLGAIGNAAALLGIRAAGNRDLQSPIEILNRQVQHTARLVDDLLDVSRITKGRLELRKEIVDLVAVAIRAADSVRPSMSFVPLQFTVDVPEEPVWLLGDPTRLEQVFGNLLNNAVTYNEPTGEVHLSLKRTASEAVIEVRDSGIGISPEVLPRIFGLFTQEDQSLARSRGGLGIGLKLVKTLVEMHGGHVAAHSGGHGLGATFTVTLPLPVPRPAPALPDTENRSRNIRPRKVLIVEDNADAAQTLSEILMLWGHVVRVAPDGNAAICASRDDPPEVVLLDIGLPGMDGFEVAQRLRGIEGFEGTRIVALSGYAQENDLRRSRDAGFDDHIVKPIDIRALQGLFAKHFAE